jgi:hypothetical protein
MSYQKDCYASDDSDALKRHMYLHLIQLAEECKTIGLFSETAFESIHALINAIERRYLSIVGEIGRDRSIRKAFALRQARDGREARQALFDARARPPRKRKAEEISD